MTHTTPNPGSQAAIDKGCTCPVIDNHYGRGFTLNGETVFWINENCPIHGAKGAEDDGNR